MGEYQGGNLYIHIILFNMHAVVTSLSVLYFLSVFQGGCEEAEILKHAVIY